MGGRNSGDLALPPASSLAVTLRALLATLERRFFSTYEQAEVDLLLAERLSASRSLEPRLHFCLTRHNYRMAHRETRLVRLPRYRSVVMVGCGTFPATLLYLADHSPIPTIVGIDADADAVRRAALLVGHTGHRISLVCCRGEEYDFSQSDLVYVANGTRHKTRVLLHAAATAAPGTDFLVRIPVGPGRLFYESLPGDLGDPSLAYRRRGPRDFLFWNRILLFTKSPVSEGREVFDAP